MATTTTTATFTTTAAVAAQFLVVGNVVEVRGVLLEIVSDRYFTLSGVQYAVRNLETLEGGVAEFPLGVMLPLYERG
jgi:hypothetical protein